MSVTLESWCQSDGHARFGNFVDFNEWIDNSEDDTAEQIRTRFGLNVLAQPSKGFFAGDKEAYEQAFRQYRIQRRHEVLSKEYFTENDGDDHWFQKNESRFDQLVDLLLEKTVVPFIGAGFSVAGGFPTWKDHLRQQGKTAGIDPTEIEAKLESGDYESIIESIESVHGVDVFTQEIRDVFSKRGKLEDIALRIPELFDDTLITTNYDRLLEQVYDVSPEQEVQVINGLHALEAPDTSKVTIIKLHGNISTPKRCILSKAQYDDAYGATELDFGKDIPKILRYYYTTSNLLFIGCSLNNDRTIQVFKAVKTAETKRGDIDTPQHFSIEQAPELVEELVARNAELASLGITAIWFPKGQFEKIEEVLRHARNELKYKQSH